MSGEEVTKNILTAVQLKEQGNLAFKEGDYPAAIAAYHQIYMYVNGYSSSGGGGPPGLTGQTTKQVTQEEMVQIRELKLAHYCNLAMCHMKHGPKYLKARDNCTKALAIDPDNVKALFRRGKCYAQLNELDEAKADFERVLQLQPESSDAKRELRSLRGAFEKLRKREQKKCYYDCNEAPASLHSVAPRVAPVLSERVVGRQLVPRAAAIWVDGVQLAL
ncbi:peptidyl-prolyl cis-trans isomerase fkbp4 [Chrysochromulina tobinii]|uniref:Peptidyl-prolyl cis-trans isomerase fkbp4 n=1 Tax=Chrysochromulina tobinii TaxID=1460289 RepID=A0A0M0JAL7_9EUKA|nr:peptidyl-prolyl cis-trans isomerase fkbp4 [Chrysochromulina tobinii]|eukprot:KOO23273.1 peptidyl-prolyl cis-trans isomerase fkbp4 [Chrysochromulina sp. CCMP291]